MRLQVYIFYNKIFGIQINKMDEQINYHHQERPQLMEEECSELKSDIFEQFLFQANQNHNNSIEIEKIQKPFHHYRSSKNLIRRSNFRKILNTSSSNEKLIPSSIKNDSSRENSQRQRNHFQTQNSLDSQSFRRSFKKNLEQSFSVSHTIRDSSSSVSQRSDSKSGHNIIIIPFVCKQQAIIAQEKKGGCNCKRSKCLKLYCQCFQKQLFCGGNCNCHSCGNNVDNKEEHQQAVIQALARNAHGFEEDEQKDNNPQHKSFKLGVQPTQVRKGCKCKKTKCVKNYCQCYQNGMQCSIFCRCQGCINNEEHQQHKPY